MTNLNIYNSTTTQWESIKVDTRLSVLKNTVTLTADVNWVFIGITSYNPADDALYVVKKDTVKGNHQLILDEDYTFNTSSLKIFSKDGSNWKQGDVFEFSVWKNVERDLPSADGALLQNGSVTDSKLAMPITPALTDLDGNISTNLYDRLLGIDTKIKGIQKETPFIFVTNYDDLVTDVGKSTEDWTNAIQTALNASPTYKQVVLPMQTCRITKTLEVPYGTSLIGFGNASVIQPDFGYWQTTDYRTIRILGIEGVNYGESSYNRYFENFSVVAKNNASLQTTAIDIGTPTTISTANAVNYAALFVNFRNILVSKFDTAWNIRECWMSNFTAISITDCRVGLSITGKAVNLNFDKMMMTNFSSDYTSSTGKMYGIVIDNKTTYSDGNGRPEGLSFSNSLVFGANTNLHIKNCLHTRFTELILDGASEDTIIIESPDNLSIKGCYVYTSGSGKCCINMSMASNQESVINIYDNYFIGTTGTQYGIYGFTNNYRYGVTIQNNLFEALSNPIHVNYLGRSKILSNYGKNNRGDFIYIQSESGDTIVDGNNSIDAYPVLRLHPTTADSLQIGFNTSATTKTYYQGFTTINAGATSGSCGNGFYYGTQFPYGTVDPYYRAVTIVQPLGNIGSFWVEADTTGTEATIKCSTAPTVNTKIYYQAIAVPYAATV